MVQSKYNIIHKIDNKGYLIFNSLHQNLIFISSDDYKDFLDCNTNNHNFNVWEKEHLILEDNIDEYEKKYDELYNEQRDDTQYFTILTTTACNARCSYCFEKGIVPQIMSEKTSIDVAKSIISSICTSHLHINWFGGEPLLNSKAIDTITKIVKPYCENQGILYTSSIITNGSLLSDDIAYKFYSEWNIVGTQITLDGTEHKYNEIKNYTDNSNFNLVINNIKKLAIKDKKVTIRVNFNKNNIEDCLQLIEYLYNVGLDSSKIFLYFHPILNYGKIEDINLVNDQFKTIYNKLYQYQYIKTIKYFNLHLAKVHCEAELKHSCCIYPDGKVAKCQSEKNTHLTNTIYTPNFMEVLNNEWSQLKNSLNYLDNCKHCKFLPLCSGGCKYWNSSCLNKTQCNRCLLHKYSFNAIMETLAKIYKLK